MTWEKYLPDPARESTVRLCGDEDGLVYLFWSNGAEQVFDNIGDALKEYAGAIARWCAA